MRTFAGPCGRTAWPVMNPSFTERWAQRQRLSALFRCSLTTFTKGLTSSDSRETTRINRYVPLKSKAWIDVFALDLQYWSNTLGFLAGEPDVPVL
jgi:hypothetical protein